MKNRTSRLIKLTKTLIEATSKLPKHSSKFSRKDFTLQQHVVLLCLKVKTKQRYRAFVDLLETMTVVQEVLGLDKIPHYSTLDRAFLRLKNHILVALLQAESTGFAAIDATSFDRGHASLRYQIKCKKHLRAVKATFLIDDNQNIIDLHCTTTRKHDSKIVLPLTQKHRLRVLCADMGYDDRKVRRTLRMRGIRVLIPYRSFKPKHKYWNSLFDQKLYHKRSLCETVNSVIKRRYSDTLYSKNWRNQFKELKLLAVVYNFDRNIKDLLEVFNRAC